MKRFKVVPVPTEVAESARRAAASGRPDHAVVTADSPNGYPCRHCLHWAKPGDQLVLFPYTSVPNGYPYSETGPIFVHLDVCSRYNTVEEYPADFRDGRIFRAYDINYNMIDAVIANGSKPESVIANLFDNPATAFIQARSAARGCYTFGVERV